MDVNALYNIAKGFVNKMQHEKPAIASEPGASLCLLLTEDGAMYSGVTGMGIHEGNIVPYPAECVALIAMHAAGKTKAKQMILLSMADNSILVPCLECLEMMMLLNAENACCEAAVSEERAFQVRELMSDDAPEEQVETASSPSVDYFSGFGDAEPTDDAAPVQFESGFDESYAAPQHAPVKKTEASSLGAPAEFASGVAVDESNPFYEAPVEADTQEPEAQSPRVSHTEQPGEAAAPAKSLSKAELLKQAKKKKKVAKSNFNFFKKKS